MLNNIPYEMRNYPQWIVWKYETINNKPTKVPYALNGFKASVANPQTWASYDKACEAVHNGFDGIGFVLTDKDPFCFIDLDHTDNKEEFERQQLIFENFAETYAELSPSGKGLHIICKGKVEQGVKRKEVEVYSQLRFMTMTGNVYNSKPIVDCSQKINNLYTAFKKAEKDIKIDSQPAQYSDEHLFNIASRAENGQKFYDLWCGQWKVWYASQSEADHALINIIAYYSRNVEQIIRMFRMSALGKREKAMRNDYVMSMVKRSFDNYIPEINIGAMAENLKKSLADLKEEKTGRGNLMLQLYGAKELFPNDIAPVTAPLPDLKNLSYSEYALKADFPELPKGLINELARFIYAQSPRPIREISLVTALALMSGICGRSYNISGTGLNNYFVLLAPTGIGKEGISKGINRLLAEIIPQQPMATSFVGLGELVSGVSLLRYLSEESQCCITVQGEFGMTMQRMTGRNATAPMLQLRKILLDLYNKSGKGEVMRSTVYADKAKNIAEIEAPAFSLLGESTPETFYECLSDSLVDEGLMSRFNIIEVFAKRPPLNKTHNTVEVPVALRDYLLNLASNCLTLNATNKVIDIQIDNEAQKELDDFDIFCDDLINNAQDESYRQLWNRGHLKVLKISGLFAIAENMYNPVVTYEHVEYAKTFVISSIQTLLHKYQREEIGAESVSDTKQLKDLTTVIKNTMLKIQDMPIELKMKQDYVLPYSLILSKVSSYKSYKKGRLPPAMAIKNNAQTLIDMGAIAEVRPHVLESQYGYRGKAWVITNPKYFLGA